VAGGEQLLKPSSGAADFLESAQILSMRGGWLLDAAAVRGLKKLAMYRGEPPGATWDCECWALWEGGA